MLLEDNEWCTRTVKTTPDPCRHTFGYARSFVHDFTVRDLWNIVLNIALDLRYSTRTNPIILVTFKKYLPQYHI